MAEDENDVTTMRTMAESAGPAHLGQKARHSKEFEALTTTSTRLGARYDDGDEIGRGGHAAVRSVYDKNLFRWTAIKSLDPGFAMEASKALRFLEEARLTGQLEHPAIVPVHELGNDEGVPYFSMKYVKGQTLEELGRDAGEERLEPEHLARMVRALIKVCEAIAYAHSRGVVHRDLKPENIMIGDFGQVYVMDWGIAHIMPVPTDDPVLANDWVQLPGRPFGGHDTGVIGTPSYMPPEQTKAKAELIDERTDIFALGATLYYMLTGKPPYAPGPPLRVLVAAAQGLVQSPEEICDDPRLPTALCRIAMKCMARDPVHRYQTVSELIEELEAFTRGVWYLPTTTFKKGSAIVREGEQGEDAYIIESGTCVVYGTAGGGGMRVLTELGPGEVFGETAVFTSRPRTATVVAKSKVVVQVVNGATLQEAAGMNSWVGPFVRAMAERFFELDHQVRTGEIPALK